MLAARNLLLLGLLPLFSACQLFQQEPPASAPSVRYQGTLSQADGKLLFQPCQEARTYVITHDTLDLAQETTGQGSGKLFADLGGALGKADGSFSPSRLYRLGNDGAGCADPDFKRLTLLAGGEGWSVKVSGKGLMLEQAKQPPVALPYLEEQLPGGLFNLTSEANGTRLELWVAPQRCSAADGSLQHLTAELRIDGNVQRGCAYYGGMRGD
jgi:putative lipoprotein